MASVEGILSVLLAFGFIVGIGWWLNRGPPKTPDPKRFYVEKAELEHLFRDAGALENRLNVIEKDFWRIENRVLFLERWRHEQSKLKRRPSPSKRRK